MAASFDLSGKVAVVTGASRGLGQYFSRALAHAGADIVITSRTVESLAQTKSEIEAMGRRALPCMLDTRKIETIQPMVEAAMAAFGRIDILVNNAGCNIRKPSVDITPEDWDMVVDTILKGAFFVSTAVVRAAMMPQRKGRIINIGSITSVFGSGGVAPYCASRGGIRQLTMSLADDWGPYGITVNCLAPGWFRTRQTAVLCDNEAWVSYMTDRIPVKRLGQPDDLDGTVVFLASDASAYVTGQLLLVDGGLSTGAMRATVEKK
jgi:NAD(P)-dependent dehydrogenase (short-subunit alcohol dehydrogenase family)